MNPVPLTETELYLHEISKIQGSLENLLVNLSNAVCKLPDNRDHKDLVNEVVNIKSNLDKVYSEMHGCLEQSKEGTEFLAENLETFLEEIKKTLGKFESLSIDDLKNHMNTTSGNHTLLTNKISKDLINVLEDLGGLIIETKKINDFINSLIKIYERLSNKYEDSVLTPNDAQLIVEMARRSDKIYKIWTPRKKVLLWIFGILITCLSIFSGINAFIGLIGKLFEK